MAEVKHVMVGGERDTSDYVKKLKVGGGLWVVRRRGG